MKERILNNNYDLMKNFFLINMHIHTLTDTNVTKKIALFNTWSAHLMANILESTCVSLGMIFLLLKKLTLN